MGKSFKTLTFYWVARACDTMARLVKTLVRGLPDEENFALDTLCWKFL